MSSSRIIVTSTDEVCLESRVAEWRAQGIPMADPAEVRRINELVLESRGVSRTAPIPSPSFRTDPETLRTVSQEIENLINQSEGLLVNEDFSLAIDDWKPMGPVAVLCLTTGGAPERGGTAIGVASPACRKAWKIHQLWSLANSGMTTVFLNSDGMNEDAVNRQVEGFPGGAVESADAVLDLEGYAADSRIDLPTGRFRIGSGPRMPGWVREELEHWHREKVRQTALEDRFRIYEKALKKAGGNLA